MIIKKIYLLFLFTLGTFTLLNLPAPKSNRLIPEDIFYIRYDNQLFNIEHKDDCIKLIQHMVERDQTNRKNFLNNIQGYSEKFMRESDKINSEILKKIIDHYGWPTISLFGIEASHQAWLIIQHADHDIQFQEECLLLMQQYDKNDVDPKLIAFLYDRIQINQKKPQRYGTQLFMDNDEYQPFPLEDPQNVDTLRKQIGFEPLADYIKYAMACYEKLKENKE